MLSFLRARLTYANVVSSLALFLVVSGGTAYAAITITGKNVKDGSLSGADVKNNSLTGSDVSGLGAGDFRKGALPTGPRGATGATGATGAAGAPGAPGQAGAPGEARAYATIAAGALVPARSKGIAGLSYGCYGSACASTPLADADQVRWKYCFKLDFEPNIVQVTPLTRGASSSYGIAEIPTAGAPAQGSGVSTAGCPTGFQSADATAIGPGGTNSDQPVNGLFVSFD